MPDISIRVYISLAAAFLAVFLSAKIRRNREHVFYTDIRMVTLCFSLAFLFSMFALSALVSHEYKQLIPLGILAFLFSVSVIGVCVESIRISGRQLILNNEFNKIRTLNIDEIVRIDFRNAGADPDPDGCINFIISGGACFTMKGFVENLDGLVRGLKAINPGIEIPSEIPAYSSRAVTCYICSVLFFFIGINALLMLFIA